MIQELLKSIEKTIFAPYQYKVNGNQIILTEDNPGAKCKQVTFQTTGKSLVYKFDRVVNNIDNHPIREPFIFLNPTPPLRSKCDYLIFYTHTTKKGGEKLYVLVCNMKSDESGNMEDQLYSGYILADFLLQTAFRSHQSWHSSDAEKKYKGDFSQFKDKFVVYKEIAISSKYPINKGTSKVNAKPIEKRHKLPCGKIYELNNYIS